MTQNIPFQAEQPVFGKVGSISELIHMTPEEREKYNISIDSYRTNLSVMKNERAEGIAQGMAQGMAKGREEGMAEGLQKGMAKGRTEGLAEGEARKALSIACNLKQMGMPSDQIAEITGLSVEKIETL